MGLIKSFAVLVGEEARKSISARREEKMPPEAKEKLRKAIEMAEAGNIEMMGALGDAYLLGKEARYDPNEAVKWYTMAAKNGNVRCMYNLGLLYMGSDLTWQVYNENLAGQWFNEAAKRGWTDAQKMLRRYKYDAMNDFWRRID